MAYLNILWPAFGNIFNTILAPTWMHILMHALLYAMLGFLLTIWSKPVFAKHFLILASLTFLVGCMHEALQRLTAGIWPGWFPELYNIFIDLARDALGVSLWRVGQLKKNEPRIYVVNPYQNW
jgi:hypothetical protein